MRRFFFIVGVLATIVILGGGIGLFVLARNGAARDADAKAYVDGAVVAITARWDAAELMKRASPEFLKATRPDDLAALFTAASAALGPLDHYDGAKGQTVTSAAIGGQTTISAHYLAAAKFEKGAASFTIALHQIDGQWRIDAFRINSNRLMHQLIGRAS